MIDEEYDEEEYDEELIAVLKHGSYRTQAGFAGEEAPRNVFSTVYGCTKYVGLVGSVDCKNWYIGEEAMQKRGILGMFRPMEHGVVRNWDQMEKIWGHTFENELRIDPYGLLLTESPNNDENSRERTTQIMFETFEVKKFDMVVEQPLICLSTGRTEGLVVDIGHTCTNVVPVSFDPESFTGLRMNSWSLYKEKQFSTMGGRDLYDSLMYS